MPRGIPNKKNKVESTEAPTKRRGRPPGSKNAGKIAKAPSPGENHKVVKTPLSVKHTNGVAATSLGALDKLEVVRANIFALRDSGQPDAMAAQVELLQNLTNEVLGYNSEAIVEKEEPLQVQVTSLPSLPSFIAPPFPAASGS